MIMKRSFITVLILFIILNACSSNNTKNIKMMKSGGNKMKEENINLNEKRLKLPSYFSINDKKCFDDLLIVYPGKDREAISIANGIKGYYIKNKKVKPEIIKDSEINLEMLKSRNLILIGNSTNNRVLNEIKDLLPIKVDEKNISINNKVYSEENTGVTYYYPNVYNTKKTMILINGNNYNALKVNNFENSDITVHKGIERIIPVHYKELAFAKFDDQWNIDIIDEINPELLSTGENDEIKIENIDNSGIPEWAKGKVIYHIFVRSFFDSNDDGIGDFQGIAEKVDYLNNLGVDIVLLSPMYDSPSNHGYDVVDYFNVTKDFGTMDDFISMVQEIHKRDMKIMLDIPFSFASKKSKYFRDAKENPDSKYDKWFYFANLQNSIFHSWNFRRDKSEREVISADLVAWNVNNPEVAKFHSEVAKFWLDPGKTGDRNNGVDGFRIDSAHNINHGYLKFLRSELKKYDQNVLLLGQIWEAQEKILGYLDNEMDIVFDFPLKDAIDKNSITDIKNVLQLQNEVFQNTGALSRFGSNHDMTRMAEKKDEKMFKLYSTLLLTLNGMPRIYYGDEIGTKGNSDGGDRNVRKPMNWYKSQEGKGMTTWQGMDDIDFEGISVEEQQDKSKSTLEFYKKLLKIRRDNIEVFKNGKIEIIENENDQLLAYFVKSEKETILVILNFGNKTDLKIKFNSKFPAKNFQEILHGKDESSSSETEMLLNIEGKTPYIYLEKNLN